MAADCRLPSPSPSHRPPQYHRRTTRQPWLDALVQLHQRGYSDARIAEVLSELNAADIALMLRHRLWKPQDVSAARRPGQPVPPWTERQVRYYRALMGLPANPQRFELGEDILTDTRGTLNHVWLAHCRDYQRASGWGHLLPRYDSERHEWTGGVELRPREVDVLNVLWTCGEMILARIAAALGLRRLVLSGHSRMTRLERYALVTRTRPRPATYTLADGVEPDVRERTVDGYERLAQRMAQREPAETRLCLTGQG